MLHRDMKFRLIMFITPYISKSPARDRYISDNGYLKQENNFWTKKYKSKILTKS